MKILFFTTDSEDYLEDSVIHGLKSIFGDSVVDYPFKSILYNDCPEYLMNKVRGKGFTLYFLLNSSDKNRQYLISNLKNDVYDYIIFGSIQRQIGLYLQLYPHLKKSKTIILDGEDTPALFGYHGLYWRKFYYWFIPKPNKKFNYFKREWTAETKFYRYYKIVPRPILKFFPEPKNLTKISFSIPEEKIIKSLPEKTKLFPKHIVDKEVASKVEGSVTKYAFDNETEYYTDLQSSKYGITTKRSGWDCLRHYEIAANGAVICFKDLDKKPDTCAPHGLIPNVNCISYKNYDDLMNTINKLSEEQYRELQYNCWQWAKNNSTTNAALKILKKIKV